VALLKKIILERGRISLLFLVISGVALVLSGFIPKTASSISFFDLRVRGYDSLNMYSNPKEGADYHCFWFAKQGDGWRLLGKGDTTIEFSPDEYVYAFVQTPKNFVDIEETKAQNPRVNGFIYGDLDGDCNIEYAFRLNLKDIAKPVSGNPTLYFYPYLLSYETPSIDSPSSVNGTGNVYIDWQLRLEEKKAFAVSKVVFQVNTANSSKLKLARLNIPGVGYLSAVDFGTPINNSYILTWIYPVSEAIYFKNGGNDTAIYKFTTMVESHLAHGESVNATIIVHVAAPNSEEELVAGTVQVKG
jgi:hypothetical protein